MMEKSSKKWKPVKKIIGNPLKKKIISSNWDYLTTNYLDIVYVIGVTAFIRTFSAGVHPSNHIKT